MTSWPGFLASAFPTSLSLAALSLCNPDLPTALPCFPHQWLPLPRDKVQTPAAALEPAVAGCALKMLSSSRVWGRKCPRGYSKGSCPGSCQCGDPLIPCHQPPGPRHELGQWEGDRRDPGHSYLVHHISPVQLTSPSISLCSFLNSVGLEMVAPEADWSLVPEPPLGGELPDSRVQQVFGAAGIWIQNLLLRPLLQLRGRGKRTTLQMSPRRCKTSLLRCNLHTMFPI